MIDAKEEVVMTAKPRSDFKQCGDELRGADLPRTCKLSWAHKGLHSDQDRNWVGGLEVEPQPEPLFETIQEGRSNESLTLIDGTPHRLPAISYKPGWDFYWTETRNAVDLRVDVVTKQALHLVRWSNRKQLIKLWINQSFAGRPILRYFIQSVIIETERTIMEAAATIDGKPLFEEKNA